MKHIKKKQNGLLEEAYQKQIIEYILIVLNASMIENNIGQKDRLEKLNETAKRQITILASDNNIIGITKLDDQKLIGGTNE